ncbi:MAG: hypothetical protein HKN23_18775 [Verrucomicrobiales bacterium]|nr:hypothetical protein [Verrucomicrobiales bacterium]
MKFRLLSLVGTTLFAFWPALGQSPGSPPEVEVTNVRRAFHNGEHNAFTDLVRWNDRLWLTFRSCPDGHMVFSSARVIVLSSTDEGKSWQKQHEFSVPKRDTRDPHFLVFQDKLFIYTGTWWSGEGELPREKYDLNKHLGYAVFTGDGDTWSDPTPLEGTYGHYIWRAAAHDGKAYLCGRRKRNFTEAESGTGGSEIVESAMLQSDDGLIWRFHSLFQENRGNETAFLFEDDGSAIAVSRCGSKIAQLGRSNPPHKSWTQVDLPEYIGGPLLAKWNDRYLVGGRRTTKNGPKTTLYWLEDDTLHPFAELPSGGDNSYPGFVVLKNGNGLVSWYSSHEKGEDGKPITAIYLADLILKHP